MMMTEPISAEVRDDLELPQSRRGRPHGATKWAVIPELEVEQSCVWTIPTAEELKKFRNVLSSTVHRYSRKLGREFTVRTLRQDDDGNFRIGVWRLS
jgi:hypothetical protein